MRAKSGLVPGILLLRFGAVFAFCSPGSFVADRSIRISRPRRSQGRVDLWNDANCNDVEDLAPRNDAASRRNAGVRKQCSSKAQGRRRWLQAVTPGLAAAACAPAAAHAKGRSRTEGYDVQKTEAEWKGTLSQQQYFILREGGTESPYSSVLEGEKRHGSFRCAACSTPLFDSSQKFTSGTGWPSFAKPVTSQSDPPISNVEMENVSQFQFQLAGAEGEPENGQMLVEVRGDVFSLAKRLLPLAKLSKLALSSLPNVWWSPGGK